MYYLHKHEITLMNGGREEGGWHYEAGTPVKDWKTETFTDEEAFYVRCRELNEAEHKRQDEEEEYEYSSVLAYRSTHYSYGNQSDDPTPSEYPATRPYYE